MARHPDVTDETVETFARDGVVLLRQVLDPTWMELVDLGIERNLRNPGPHHQHHYAGTPTSSTSRRPGRRRATRAPMHC